MQKKYAALDGLTKVPLLKAANLEEGGAGVLTDGTYFGSQLQVAADDLSCTEAFAKVCAAEGKRAGVNWTFSPTVRINWCEKHALEKLLGQSPFTGVNPVDPFCGLPDIHL